MHLFTLESLAIARAHVAAVGGNALLNFRMNDCVLIEHPHKNQVWTEEKGGREKGKGGRGRGKREKVEG